MTSDNVNESNITWIKIDKLLDNTLDKCFPKFLMDNTNRKIKGLPSIFLTAFYICAFLLVVTNYTIDTYNAFGNVVMKPLWQNAIVLFGGTTLFFLIYTDIRYYMKECLYHGLMDE